MTSKNSSPLLVVADKKGKIYDRPDFAALGAKGNNLFRLRLKELIKLPHGSELFLLPDRIPLGYDQSSGNYPSLTGYYPVAAFPAPGFTVTYNSAYRETERSKILPLFPYAAVAFYKGDFYIAATCVDRELRQDIRFMDIKKIKSGVRRLQQIFPHNRLMRHLEGCALVNGCPAAKNFFLNRYECPLPTSPYCNAKCIGCISYQEDKALPITQPRIKFIPQAVEVAETALFHIKNVKNPVVSFGQGCEGEPLLVPRVLEETIKIIRKETKKGIINLNTNASRPDVLKRLFDAGLDSIRVSMNSVQERYYKRYYQPQNYKYSDVVKSIKAAKRKKKFVSINYLSLPGFTDTREEYNALRNFIKNTKIDMIQWRNLNYDPLHYFKSIGKKPETKELLGMRRIIKSIKDSYPYLMHGYFNPSWQRIKNKRG